jgi:hypothetical protein
MKSDDRKAARSAYKERKTIAGIYAVRCGLSGQIWVGQAPNLDTVQNRLWFTLRSGNNPHGSLQSAWTAHGAESFAFEPLERLQDEELSYVREAALKERLAYWRAKLGAAAI